MARFYENPMNQPKQASFTPSARLIERRAQATKNQGGGGPTQSQSNVPAPSQPQTSQPQTSQPSAPRTLNWRDSAYNSQIASIQRALQDFETGAQQRGERYGTDYTTSLNRMGYRPGEKFTAMPNILEANTQSALRSAADAQGEQPLVQPVSGAFDIEGQYDPYTTAARGTRGLRDDFAGRGTIRSSDFARSFGEFQNRLNQQLESMETGRSRFAEDLATDVSQQRTRSQESQQQAQRDAMMRAAIAAAGGGGF
jgi:hypothetical protein